MTFQIDPRAPYFLFNSSLLPCAQFHYSMLEGEKIIYEVMRVMGGKPLFLEEHFQRLIHSCEKWSLTFDQREVWQLVVQFISSQMVTEKNLRISLCFRSNSTYNMVVTYIESHYPSVTDYVYGVSAELLRTERNNPSIKAVNQQLREQTDEIIRTKGAYEVLLVNSRGEITEGSRSNFFAVKGCGLYTPPLHQVLEGITRQKVVQLARKNGIECKEQPIRVAELQTFDGFFITGTSPRVLPICRIGELPFGPIPSIVQTVMGHYNLLVENYLQGSIAK